MLSISTSSTVSVNRKLNKEVDILKMFKMCNSISPKSVRCSGHLKSVGFKGKIDCAGLYALNDLKSGGGVNVGLYKFFIGLH